MIRNNISHENTPNLNVLNMLEGWTDYSGPDSVASKFSILIEPVHELGDLNIDPGLRLPTKDDLQTIYPVPKMRAEAPNLLAPLSLRNKTWLEKQQTIERIGKRANACAKSIKEANDPRNQRAW